MKKSTLLFLVLAATLTLHAQWTDNAAQNTFIANASADGGEVYLATDQVTGDTYVQWCQMRTNGWVPTLQRLDFEGVPQWDANGITITGQQLATWSQGVAMAATNNGGVVTCFSNEAGQCIAVRINADGSFPWGEQGLVLFDGQGGSRTELMAGDDGGVWALGADFDNTYLCHIDANGTLSPTITISDNSDKSCVFGLMVPGIDNSVFVVYEKETWAYTYYYEKEIWVVGYTQEGIQIEPEVQLMSAQTIGGSYAHYVVPDGTGGGYAYIWHPAIGNAFNTYVFHFDHNGHSTISDLNGISVHSQDPANFYRNAYATVDPESHDLIIAYEQTDAATQSQSRIHVNRITATGEKVWGDGIVAADYFGYTYSDIKVDAFEDGSGFSLIYTETGSNPYFTTIEAMAFDMNGLPLWTRSLCSNAYRRTMCDNSTGFNLGQNIVTWVNCIDGGIYGQNIAPDGTMGPVELPEPCYPPEKFDGSYVYNGDDQTFGALLSWLMPETPPLHYNLYVVQPNGCTTTIEVEPTENTYYDEMTLIGTVIYQLTAVYEDCESDFALTSDGENFVSIEVTGIEENTTDEIVTIIKVFNVNGQSIATKNLEELGTGLYILQGLTQDGRMVSKKVVVNK